MKMVHVSDIFDVVYGVNLELNKQNLDQNGINFVSRTARNNGVSARVKIRPHIEPNPGNTISVAGGGSVMESFYQQVPYYSGRDVYILKPQKSLSVLEMLYYCVCLRANKYRYNYGRQANRTLKEILVPDINEIPSWVYHTNLSAYDNSIDSFSTQKTPDINTMLWRSFKYSALFSINRGMGPRRKDLNGKGTTPFITSTYMNNGRIGMTDCMPKHTGNVISVSRNGSVGEAFYQPMGFCSTEDVHIFIPKFNMNKYIALFMITLIRKEKYRYNYGRKWGIQRMNETMIKLPVNSDGQPDFEFMESYIKSLPCSKRI